MSITFTIKAEYQLTTYDNDTFTRTLTDDEYEEFVEDGYTDEEIVAELAEDEFWTHDYVEVLSFDKE